MSANVLRSLMGTLFGDTCSVNFYGNIKTDTPYRYILAVTYKNYDTGEDMAPIILEGYFTVY